ncbi:hypothetical protein HYU11_02245 [Candidatus Woesearchaeota archaeon]|nr:hypothetical protein [Candidatus Woesearchaeota archaeon]
MRFAFVLFAILAIAVAGVYAQEIPNVPNIRITLINQEPNPVEPGEHLIARFRVDNLGGRAAENMKLEFIDGYPFSRPGSETGVRTLGTLAGTQRDKLGAVVSYDLLVDPVASEGTGEIFLRYSFGDGVSSKSGPFNISILARQSVVTISSVTSSPDQVLPGEKVNVTLRLVNNARSLIKNVQLKLDLSASSVPFAPFHDAQEKSVSDIPSGQSVPLKFMLVALPDSSAGVFKIPVKISYSNQLGKNFSRDDLISLTVGGKPILSAIISDQDVLRKGGTGKFTIQVVNSGLIGAKLATLELHESGDSDILSPSKIYMGTIDSDDFDTASIRIYVDSDQVKIPAVLTYRDSNNNEYSQEFSLEPKIYSSDQINSYGMGSTSVVGIVIAASVVVAGFLIYRKFFRKEQND